MKQSCLDLVIGTWFIDGLPFGEEGILVITPELRVVQFPTSVTFPKFIQTHRLWVTQESVDFLRFKSFPASEGWLRRVEISDGGWIMIAIDHDSEVQFNCRHAPAAALPSWYQGQLDRNLLRMAEIEAKKGAEQEAHARPVFL